MDITNKATEVINMKCSGCSNRTSDLREFKGEMYCEKCVDICCMCLELDYTNFLYQYGTCRKCAEEV